jgi:ABC-type Fe3+-siderophore transport system permease subunit
MGYGIMFVLPKIVSIKKWYGGNVVRINQYSLMIGERMTNKEWAEITIWLAFILICIVFFFFDNNGGKV